MKYPDDIVETGGGLYLRPRDMAKLGRLFLNKGRWNGKQIVSETWVKESTKNQLGAIPLPDARPCRWLRISMVVHFVQIRRSNVESYSARGRGGQFIFVFPRERMIAVFTGWNDNLLLFQPMEMVQEYVIPAALPDRAGSPQRTEGGAGERSRHLGRTASRQSHPRRGIRCREG